MIPLSESVLTHVNIHNCVADVALLHSRKFRIGWAAQNSLFTLNTLENCQSIQPTRGERKLLLQKKEIYSNCKCFRHSTEHQIENVNKLFSGRGSHDFSRSIVVNMKIPSTRRIDNFTESIVNHLQAQLKCSQTTAVTKSNECPQFRAAGGTAILSEHLSLAEENASVGGSEADDYATSVWSLCQALWGEVEELDGHEVQSHLSVTRRRELLSDWLETTVEATQEQRVSSIKSGGYLEHLMMLLTGHKVADACELAFNNNDLNLAFLLAQSSGGPSVRQLMQHQLSQWQEVEADKFVAVQRLKAYMLVAGTPLIASSHGPINVFEDLDWLKAFAVSCNLFYFDSVLKTEGL